MNRRQYQHTINLTLSLGFLMFLPALSITAQPLDTDLTDANITSAIETEYWLDDAVPSNRIDIRTSNGIVNLTGEVSSILARDRAERIAEAIVGVRAVVNRLQVNPPAERTDTEIENAVKNALLNDPATESYELTASVDDGFVTLTGTVDSYQEKKLSADVAKGVKGVRGLRNDITVNYQSDRPDYEIKQEIEARLANDIRIDDNLVNVKVNDGRVTLTGAVGSLAEKNHAAANAWVAGVNSVNADELKIEWHARDEMRRKQMYVTITDERIKEAVNDALLYDPRVASFRPNVTVNDGTVTLTGVVDNLRAKQAAEQDARNTIGVIRVKNNLKVRPPLTPSPDKLEDRVADYLTNDPYIDRYDINIDIYDGSVTLAGQVNTSWEKSRAAWLVQNVKGVTEIDNNIEFKHQWTPKPDHEIKADVRDQIFWSPFADSDDINVSVNDGIVILSGEVATLGESRNAVKNAFQGGAKDVVNNLTVTYKQYGPYNNDPYSPFYVYPYGT